METPETVSEIRAILTIKTREHRYCHRSCVFIVNENTIIVVVLASLLLTLNSVHILV